MQALIDELTTHQLRENVSAVTHLQGYNDALATFIPQATESTIVLNRADESLLIRLTDLRYSTPVSIEADGFAKELVDPCMCVVRGSDYSLIAIITIECYHSPDPALPRTATHEGLTLRKRWVGHPYFSIPCMIGSDYCTTKLKASARTDPRLGGNAGCFVISGQIRHLITPTHQRKNVVVARVAEQQSGRNVRTTLEFRSDHRDKLRATSTLRGTVTDAGARIRLPFIEVDFTPAEVMTLVAMSEDDTVEPVDATQFLLPYGASEPVILTSFVHATDPGPPRPIDELAALCERDARRLLHVARTELFPHAATAAERITCLGLTMRYAALVHLGVLRGAERDSAAYTRLSGVVTVLGEFYRSLHNTMHLPRIARALQQRHAMGVDISSCLLSLLPTGNNTLTSKLRSAILTGRFTQQLNDDPISKSNLIQSAQKMNPRAMMGHQAKTLKPVNREGKDVKARQLGGDCVHVYDVADSTEGQTCGLLNTVCALSRVRRHHDFSFIRRLIDAVLLRQHNSDDGVWVELDGVPIWRAKDAAALCKDAVAARRDGRLPFDLSVAHVAQTKSTPMGSIRLSIDAGEVLAPLFVTKRMPITISQIEAIRQLGPSAAWRELVATGAIEYVGVEEVLYSSKVVAQTWRAADPTLHEWAEIDAALSLFGPCTVFTPASHMNQGPRNSYHANMTKQAHGPRVPTQQSHETLQYSLNYPQVS